MADSRSPSPPSRRWIRIGSFGGALLVASLATSQVYFSMIDHGHEVWRIFAWEVVSWTWWATLAPRLLATGMRLAVPERRPPRWPLRLLAGAVGSTLGHLAVSALALVVLQPFEPVVRYSLTSGVTYSQAAWLTLGPFLYLGIVGVGYGLGSALETKAAQLRQARLEAELAQAQLEALRLEIQPHFLFNTLHSIAAQVRKGAGPEALEMLLGLSELLRSTLERSMRPQVTVSEEIALLGRYVELQRVRFADRLRVRLQIDPECRELAVPVLLLQPLVENSIRHGIAPRPGPGSIEVRARRLGDRLVLEVLDDGLGLPQGFDLGRDQGIGLGNTRTRVLAVSNGEASFTVRPRSAGGTRVRVELPARLGPAPERLEEVS